MATEHTPKAWKDMTNEERAAEKALPKAERQHLAWLRTMATFETPGLGRPAQSKRGTWGRTLTSGCRAGRVAALTAEECRQLGLKPGPGNI